MLLLFIYSLHTFYVCRNAALRFAYDFLQSLLEIQQDIKASFTFDTLVRFRSRKLNVSKHIQASVCDSKTD